MSELEELYTEAHNELIQNRDDTMSFIEDEAGYNPTLVNLLSEELNSLLAFDSQYMQTAKANSKEQAEKAGMLKSGFNEGVGEAKAIDEAFGVAQENVYTDVFNAFQDNTAAESEWIKAWKVGAEDQWYQGNEVYDQFAFDLSEIGKQTDYGFLTEWNETIQEMTLDYMDKKYLNTKETLELQYNNYFELLDKQQEYQLLYNDQAHSYALDYMENQFTNTYNLQEWQNEWDTQSINLANQFTNAYGQIQAYQGLQGEFLNEMTEIMYGEGSVEEKNNAIEALTTHYNLMFADVLVTDDAPDSGSWFTFDDIYLDTLMEFTEQDAYPEWTGNVPGTLGTWEHAKGIIHEIDLIFHGEDVTREMRAASPVYMALETIRGDGGISGFEAMADHHPKTYEAILDWYGDNTDRWQDEPEEILMEWAELMGKVTYLDAEDPISALNTAINQNIPEGNTSNYYKIEWPVMEEGKLINKMFVANGSESILLDDFESYVNNMCGTDLECKSNYNIITEEDSSGG